MVFVFLCKVQFHVLVILVFVRVITLVIFVIVFNWLIVWLLLIKYFVIFVEIFIMRIMGFVLNLLKMMILTVTYSQPMVVDVLAAISTISWILISYVLKISNFAPPHAHHALMPIFNYTTAIATFLILYAWSIISSSKFVKDVNKDMLLMLALWAAWKKWLVWSEMVAMFVLLVFLVINWTIWLYNAISYLLTVLIWILVLCFVWIVRQLLFSIITSVSFQPLTVFNMITLDTAKIVQTGTFKYKEPVF